MQIARKNAKIWLPWLAAIIIAILALFIRARAAGILPNDYDEWVYMTASRDYASAMQQGDWQAIPNSVENYEHPIFGKLVYAVGILDLDLVPVGNGNYLVNEMCSQGPACDLLARSRTIAAVFGALAAGLLALLNPLAGLLLAVHTFAVKYTSVAYLEALPAMTSLAAIMAYSRWLGGPVARGAPVRRRSAGWLAISSLFLGISAASKYMYAMVGIVIALHFLIDSLWQRRFNLRTLLPLAAWGFAALAIFFLCDPYLWPDPARRLQDSVAFSQQYSQSGYVESFQYPTWQPIRWLSRPVTTFKARIIPQLPGDFPIALDGWILWLALLGFPRLAFKRPLYALWLVVGMLFLLAWTTKWPQYVLVIIAPWCLAAGEGLFTLFWLGRVALGKVEAQPAE